jgi:chromosome partitioning protein
MLVVAVASHKGGSGKTTLAGHLAVEADRQGAGPVALIDTDPLGTLAEWSGVRASKTPHFAHTTRETLARDLPRLRQAGMALVFIDTPPASSTAIREAVQFADLVLVPTRPSPHDLRVIGETVDLVGSLGKPLLFVINGAASQAKITGEATSLLSQHGSLAPAVLHHRVDYAASMIDGRTVMELPGATRSSAEIAALWACLSERLHELARAAAAAPAGARPAASAASSAERPSGPPPRAAAAGGAG